MSLGSHYEGVLGIMKEVSSSYCSWVRERELNFMGSNFLLFLSSSVEWSVYHVYTNYKESLSGHINPFKCLNSMT